MKWLSAWDLKGKEKMIMEKMMNTKTEGEHIYKENRADGLCCPLSFR